MASPTRESAYPVPPTARGHMPHVTQNPSADSNEDMDPTGSQALEQTDPGIRIPPTTASTNSTAPFVPGPTHQGAGGSVQTCTVLEFCSLF